MSTKTWIVYKVEFGNTSYFVRKNPYPEFSTNQNDAKHFTWKAAHDLAMKLNRGLDKGTPYKYGWAMDR